MASEQTVIDCLGQALWDPHPTKTDLRARQLAAALGYPVSWRVVRVIERLDGRLVIVDRIYTGKPGSGCDMFYNHDAAMKAAETWIEGESTPFGYGGGQLLPRQPKYGKGDKVQVLYDGDWWDATVMRRKEHPEGFRYQVHYAADNSKQSGVEEALIRRPPAAKDPRVEAEKLGFREGWEAFSIGGNRWKIVSPDGDAFTSKKKALEAYQESLLAKDAGGDPPWRTTGHDYLGRSVLWTTEHKVSARRKVTIEQVGKITGWIGETDVDKAGEPGFVSEKTGKPAQLFHVEFDDDPYHQYASLLVSSQDLEEYEVLECLMPEEETTATEQPKKKARKR